MKSIEITTTQNVTIEYELSSLRERGLGVLLDLAISFMGYGTLVVLLRAVFDSNIFGTLPEHVWLVIFPLGVFFLYNICFEILNAGQTPGKAATGSKVVRLDGKDPEWSDVLLRAVLHLVDSIFCFGAIGALFIKTTDKSQRLGDMAANTTVIKIQGSHQFFRLSDVLGIQSLENYQPVYPQVRRLHERDMLFVKTLLSRYQRFPNYAHEVAIEDLVTHLMPLLDIPLRPTNRIEFLKTILRDYIVLTR